jgi:aspartate aminotransferase-like enzyme
VSPFTRERLHAPGPVAVPEQVRSALALPVLHHRTSAFRETFIAVRAQLAEVMAVPGDDVMIVSGSGTTAFEAAMVTTLPAGSRVLALCGGKFGDRWAAMARGLGHVVTTLDVPWGETFAADEVARALSAGPAPDAVTLVHSETSTGVLHDVAAIAAVVRAAAPEALLLLDVVTSLAAAPIDPRGWGVDALVAGSQKGVMLPPGLGFVWLSERAWSRAAEGTRLGYTLDLARERTRQRSGDGGATPATSLIVAAQVALGGLLAYGLPRRYGDLRRRHAAISAAGVALGARPFAASPSPALAILEVPAGVAAPDVVRALARRGVRIAGGQDHLAATTLRPSLLGDADDYDAIVVAAALEDAWRDVGIATPPGVAVTAAFTALRRAERT